MKEIEKKIVYISKYENKKRGSGVSSDGVNELNNLIAEVRASVFCPAICPAWDAYINTYDSIDRCIGKVFW